MTITSYNKASSIALPIGYDDFGKITEKKLNLVDKSLFIKELLDDEKTEVVVITRPRRFGKTLNLSMLQYFFSPEVIGQSTKGLFENFNIAKAGKKYMDHQGKYPVVFMTLKDIRDHDYDTAYMKFCALMRRVYADYRYLMKSTALYDDEKQLFERILLKNANKEEVCGALRTLTEYLYRHHGVKPWLLIDEYDTPLQSAYLNGYYDKMIDLIRDFFGSAFKTNPCFGRAVITGILRISKESLFSGVNNLEVYSVLNPKYSEYFGFTEKEVSDLIQQFHLEEYSDEIRDWYNGYQFGDTTIYNPWSMVHCLQQEDRRFMPHWIGTSGNELVKDLMVKSNTEFKRHFESLLQGLPVQRLIDENMVFADLNKNHEIAVWTLLLMSGYLKVTKRENVDQGMLCMVAIPNREVRILYRQVIEQWLANGHGVMWYNDFLKSLLMGDIAHFREQLKELMEETISHHDVTKKSEAFYHGLMIGLTASFGADKKNYEFKSNRESGYGRYDYLIMPVDPNHFTILLEFKKVVKDDFTEETEFKDVSVQLEKAALDAITQIHTQGYLAEVKQRGRKNIILIGLSFLGKHFCIREERV